ncbi:UNVERIFIED_CONTAM: hypothetical protein HDU68_006409 [Siphonaria sp. JEL0065]|nr:hypothetical protein HDU68_006409 [Siphonaria sp. JEL0065]
MNAYAVLVALLISSVSAHFKVRHASGSTLLPTYAVYTPKFRPGTGRPELISPCGNITLGPRTEFPIVGGFVNGNYGHNGTGHISAVVSETDPSADQFQKYFINVRGGANATFNAGNFSEAVDFSKVPGAAEGAPVTVQMVLYNGNEVFYLCGDLTLKDNRPPATYAAPAATTGYVAPPTTALYSSAKTLAGASIAALVLAAFF